MTENSPTLITFHDNEFWPFIHKMRCYSVVYHRPPPKDRMIWWYKHSVPECDGKPWELMYDRATSRIILFFLVNPQMLMMVGVVDCVVTKGGVMLSSFEEIKSFLLK